MSCRLPVVSMTMTVAVRVRRVAPPMKAAAPTTAYEDRLTGRLLPLRRTIARIICPVILPPVAQMHGWVLLSAHSTEHGSGEEQVLMVEVEQFVACIILGQAGVLKQKQSGKTSKIITMTTTTTTMTKLTTVITTIVTKIIFYHDSNN